MHLFLRMHALLLSFLWNRYLYWKEKLDCYRWWIFLFTIWQMRFKTIRDKLFFFSWHTFRLLFFIWKHINLISKQLVVMGFPARCVCVDMRERLNTKLVTNCVTADCSKENQRLGHHLSHMRSLCMCVCVCVLPLLALLQTTVLQTLALSALLQLHTYTFHTQTLTVVKIQIWHCVPVMGAAVLDNAEKRVTMVRR